MPVIPDQPQLDKANVLLGRFELANNLARPSAMPEYLVLNPKEMIDG